MATWNKTTAIAAAKSISAYQALTTAQLDTTAWESAVVSALATYSQRKPTKKAARVAGTGSQYYKLATILTDFVADVSVIEEIDYPAPTLADNDVPSLLIEGDEWEIFTDTDGDYIRFKGCKPSTSQYMRILYTIPKEFDGSGNVTIPTQDVQALQWLAASNALVSYCGYFAQSIAASQFQTDVVSWNVTVAEMRRLAELFQQKYELHMSSGGSSQLATIDTDLDWPPPHGGVGFLTHGKNTR